MIPLELAASLFELAELAEKIEAIRQIRIARGDSFMDIMGIQPIIDKMNITEL